MNLWRAILAFLTALLLGNATPTPSPAPNRTLASVYLSYGGYNMPIMLEIKAAEDGMSAIVCDHFNETETTAPLELLERAQALMEQYEVAQWDGFHGSNSMMLDGEDFSMNATFTDGSSISASGSNAFPPNYSAFRDALTELLWSASN